MCTFPSTSDSWDWLPDHGLMSCYYFRSIQALHFWQKWQLTTESKLFIKSHGTKVRILVVSAHTEFIEFYSSYKVYALKWLANLCGRMSSSLPVDYKPLKCLVHFVIVLAIEFQQVLHVQSIMQFFDTESDNQVHWGEKGIIYYSCLQGFAEDRCTDFQIRKSMFKGNTTNIQTLYNTPWAPCLLKRFRKILYTDLEKSKWALDVSVYTIWSACVKFAFDLVYHKLNLFGLLFFLLFYERSVLTAVSKFWGETLELGGGKSHGNVLWKN